MAIGRRYASRDSASKLLQSLRTVKLNSGDALDQMEVDSSGCTLKKFQGRTVATVGEKAGWDFSRPIEIRHDSSPRIPMELSSVLFQTEVKTWETGLA